MNDNFLFPPRDERLRLDDYLTIALSDADQRVSHGPVTPTIDLDCFRTDLLEWTIAGMERGVVHMNNPRYLGLFNPAPTFPAQCADRIAATFNPQLATSTTSPVAVEIEAHVARLVAGRVGLAADAAGHFTSGGSEANYTALVCALTKASPAFATIGSRAFAGQPVFYISADSHLAWIKMAHQAGVGRAAARLVPTDGSGRMSLDALTATMRTDTMNGCVPFMIVATAGTTNAGMIDPLERCAEIARGAALWYHVDAAWGGGVIASERLRGMLAGIQLADSVTIDAHKWFATTMGCGMFLTARPGILSDVFNVSASYMPSHAPTVDPYVTTAQWRLGRPCGARGARGRTRRQARG
jgi:aromatic-L-amino-acid/L-tryptophan decarboxylase